MPCCGLRLAWCQTHIARAWPFRANEARKRDVTNMQNTAPVGAHRASSCRCLVPSGAPPGDGVCGQGFRNAPPVRLWISHLQPDLHRDHDVLDSARDVQRSSRPELSPAPGGCSASLLGLRFEPAPTHAAAAPVRADVRPSSLKAFCRPKRRARPCAPLATAFGDLVVLLRGVWLEQQRSGCIPNHTRASASNVSIGAVSGHPPKVICLGCTLCPGSPAVAELLR